jgi:hypothetical protein
MSSKAAMAGRIARLQKAIEGTSRLWCFVLLPGEEIPAEARAAIKPHDSLYIKRIAYGHNPDDTRMEP